MKRIAKNHPPRWLAALLLAAIRPLEAVANPTGLGVVSGSATLQQSGSQLNVTVSPTAVLSWQNFNIAPGEQTAFLQPAKNSVVLNLIGDANPSQIFGRLTANGTVILANANGFYFGPDSFVSVGGSFIATTAPAPQDLGAGAGWQFTGLPPLAGIVNYGRITVGPGRSLYLIAENIRNEGGLSAPGGSVDLAAGQDVLVSETPDGRGLSAQVTLPAGSVDNFGRVTADGGSIAVQARVVNQNGLLQADSIQNQNGVISLVASDSLNLGANSQIFARGDASAGGSAGGNVVLRSGNTFSDTAGGQIVTTGGVNGGNGGNVEVSAPDILSLDSGMNATAAGGGTAGQLLLDPYNINLTASGASTTAALPDGSGNVNGSSGAGNTTWTLDVNTAFKNKNFSQITLAAGGNITLAAGLAWNLSASTGETTGQLTLLAAGNILFNKNSGITDANNWSVTLEAGYNFTAHSITAGSGNIYLDGGEGGSVNGSIQTAAGNVNLWAGQNIEAGAGSVYTTAGGNLFADAAAGSIYTGLLPTATADYSFTGGGATPGAVLGGFSTGAGGNVTLIAGNSISPAANLNTPSPAASYKWPGESGAYGAGNVTVLAGNQIAGNFILTAGTGTLLAGAPVAQLTAGNLSLLQSQASGVSALLSSLTATLEAGPNPNADIGTASAPILLSLTTGTWNVSAANDLYLNEVNNPDGTFNTALGFQFNYAANAAVNLWACDGITLDGGAGSQGLPRTRNNSSMLPVYAPQLSLDAGAGGITLENSLILFPSTVGSLAITTRAGGSLTGRNGAEITVSDSAGTAYGNANDFSFNPATDAAVPPALNNPNGPVKINLTGDWTDLGLNLPEAAQINVLGNINSSSLQVWNLHSADATTINVGAAAKAAMENNGVLDSATDSGLALGGAVNLNASQWQLSGPGTFNLNAGTITMDASAGITAGEAVTPATSVTLTGTLPAADAFTAALSADPVLAAKLHYDPATGLLTYAGVMSPAESAALQTALGNTQAAALQQLYAENQKDILGSTLNITTAGDVNMTLTTSIVNYGVLGDINLNVGVNTAGTLNLGNPASDAASQNQPTAGIFTSSGGNVTITAGKDINVGQSRLATYDGGNLTVLALNGNIDCGDGSLGVTYVNDAFELDPATGQLVDLLAGLGANLGGGLGFGIPGSGIRANTFVDGNARLGNILVETPDGSVNASQGGIVALHFNSADVSHAANAVLDIFAGYELLGLNGQPLAAADLSYQDTLQNVSLTLTPSDPYVFANLLDVSGRNAGQLVRVSEKRKITSSDSGIIGQVINAEATGEVSGLFAGRDVSVTAPQLGSVVVFSHDPPVISGDSLSGAEPVIVSPTVDTAAAPTAAPSAEAPSADTAAAVTTKTQADDGDSLDPDGKKRRKGNAIGLSQKVSRVTVLLPGKK